MILSFNYEDLLNAGQINIQINVSWPASLVATDESIIVTTGEGSINSLDFEGNLIPISSIEYVEEDVEVINFDVEPLDIYYAGGVLVHNKGASSEP